MKAAFFAAVLLAPLVHTATPAPAQLQVVAREYSFTLSRLHVKAGPAVIELANFGQDPHDLRLQRRGARHIAGLGVVGPGKRAELSLRLPPGRYSLWCSVANHRQLGMRATLVVSKR
ncbi:MAG TPA: cupredoxin domain-containing protein [Gaiellaceae bacterium]|nr:cupredoxin domain-containing protein [Gaiellaceae bacterium]